MHQASLLTTTSMFGNRPVRSRTDYIQRGRLSSVRYHLHRRLAFIIAQVNVELFYEAGFTALLSPRSRCYPFGDSRTRNLWRTNIQGELTGRNCQARWSFRTIHLGACHGASTRGLRLVRAVLAGDPDPAPRSPRYVSHELNPELGKASILRRTRESYWLSGASRFRDSNTRTQGEDYGVEPTATSNSCFR